MALVADNNLSSKYHRIIAVIFALLILATIGYFVFGKTKPVGFHSENNAVASQYSLPKSQPVEIKISAIGVDASVTTLGLNPDQTLEVPTDYSQVGWYTGSPTPGEIGPSVMVGHLDSAKAAAVFYKLKDIKLGDRIEIKREDGSIAVFEAESMELFSQDNFPTKKVYGPIDYAGLRLITCAGTFESSTGHYSDNLVVFAKLVK